MCTTSPVNAPSGHPGLHFLLWPCNYYNTFRIWSNSFFVACTRQNILGAEGISLQVRHIISYLLKYCVQNDGYKELLHKVIEFIGFFAIHHHDNHVGGSFYSAIVRWCSHNQYSSTNVDHFQKQLGKRLTFLWLSLDDSAVRLNANSFATTAQPAFRVF